MRRRENAHAKTGGRKRLTIIIVAALALLTALVLAVVLIGRASDKRSYDRNYEAAMLYYIDGEYSKAIEALEAAREISSTEEAVVLEARCWAAKENYSQAVTVLDGWLMKNKGSEAEDLLDQYRALAGDSEDGEEYLEIGGQRIKRDAVSLIMSNKTLTADELSSVAGLAGLTTLSLKNCGIRDISFLAELKSLDSVTLSGNEIKSLAPLSGLAKLKTLYINDNKAEDFTPLYGLDSLATLDIRGMDITEDELEELSGELKNCRIFSDKAIKEVKDMELGKVKFESDVTELDLSSAGVKDISDLTACRDLEKLILSGNKVSDLQPLAELPLLTYLDADETSVTDVTQLMGMSGLEHLDLSSDGISKITALSALTNLKWLNLSGCEIQDFSPLKNLTSLESLNLKSTGIEDADLSCLYGLTGLKSLNIEENDGLTATGVDELKLKLDGCEVKHSDLAVKIKLGSAEFDDTAVEVNASAQGVTDLSGAELFKNVRVMLLNNNAISDLEPLATLTGLEALSLNYNSVSDLTALINLTKLRVLSCEYNNIYDVGGLIYCAAIEELHLGYNPDLSDISALSGLTSLKKLTLNGTNVSDLSAVSGMTQLKYLYLDGCPVDDIDSLVTLSGLKELYIRGTNLSAEDIELLAAALPGCAIYS